MGAVVNVELARELGGQEIVGQVLEPATPAGLAPDVVARVPAALHVALWEVYWLPLACAAVGLALVVAYFPRGSVEQLAAGT